MSARASQRIWWLQCGVAFIGAASWVIAGVSPIAVCALVGWCAGLVAMAVMLDGPGGVERRGVGK